MDLAKKLGLNNVTIDWEITPALTFTIFESWGSRVRVRSIDERYYYFFIDNWQQPAKLMLMERGVKYARVLAEIKAPQQLIDNCVLAQGQTTGLDKSYAINPELKDWLITNVLDADDDSAITLVASGVEVEDMEANLPRATDKHPELTQLILTPLSGEVAEAEVIALAAKQGFFDSKYNPGGSFTNYLVDNGDALTVTDLVTGTMWQRCGYDIQTIRGMQNTLAECNRQTYAGYNDWRLPGISEAMALFTPQANNKGLHIHACFSKAQPFIFLANANQRPPGGYWFADFKQGTVFWASGFNPGGFGRFCRTI